jgi:hypothetical protein
MSQQAVIDTDQLDPQERQELLDLVDSSGFFQTPLGAVSTAAKPDRFNYSLTMEQGSQRRTVELNESDIPLEWQPLVERINLLARRFRGKS